MSKQTYDMNIFNNKEFIQTISSLRDQLNTLLNFLKPEEESEDYEICQMSGCERKSETEACLGLYQVCEVCYNTIQCGIEEYEYHKGQGTLEGKFY
jgi:hypothetical protein